VPDLKHLAHIATGVSLSKFLAVLDQCQRKCGRSKAVMFVDVLLCSALYGAGYYDYSIFGLYSMNHTHRNTFVTRLRNKRLIERLNDPSVSAKFELKSEQAKRLGKFMRRDIVPVAGLDLEGLRKFVADKEVFFAKPDEGCSGKGIEKLVVADFATLDELLAYVTSEDKNFGVIEELIVQHPDMAALYPLAINTIRIVTLVDHTGQAHVIYSTQKMGDKGKFVDNLENDGLAVPIDATTGKMRGVAHTSRLEVLDKHPYTGVVFDGYKIPYLAEAHDLVKQAALEMAPGMRYIGWDVCIMPDGPAIVEGNDWPGYDFWQLPEHTPDQIGLWPLYCALVPGLK
jgi:hypothetical protein